MRRGPLLLLMSLMLAGAAGMGQALAQEDQQPQAKEQADEPSYGEVQMHELKRDLTRLNAAEPRRDPEKDLAQQNADLDRRQQRNAGLSRRGAVALPVAPVLPAFNPLDDIIISLEMDNTDVRHILTALAKETGMNLLIDPEVLRHPANVSISFRNVPASRVFQEILRLADLYGSVDNNVLRVDPYQDANYYLDFLETVQQYNLGAGGDVLGGTQSGGGGGGGGGGRTTMNRLTGRFGVSASGPGNPNPYSQLSAILTNLVGSKGSFQLNPATGLLYVRAKPSVVRAVGRFVEDYKRILGRQILIDARILEVDLTDNFAAGINWSILRNGLATTFGFAQTLGGTVGGGATTLSLGTAQDPSVPAGNFGITNVNRNSTTVINLLKTFGNVKVVSNPTIRCKHNQPSMISVGTSNAYVRETTVNVTGGVNAVTQTTVQVDSVFDGLLIGVVPFITEDGRINLLVNPVQSSVDPGSLALQTISADSKVTLPQVALKEITTVLEMHDDETVLIGGLIDKRLADNRAAVPVVSEIPLLGRLFKNTNETNVVKELVILLHVKLI